MQKHKYSQMDVSIVISQFSSLRFTKDKVLPFYDKAQYVQRFAIGEDMRIQFTADSDDPFTAKYTNQAGIDTNVPVKNIYQDGELKILEVFFNIPQSGIYTFSILNGYITVVSAPVCIQAIEDLEDTFLLEYTHRKNDYNTIFEDKTFRVRFEGGIRPEDISQALDNNMFRDQRGNPLQTAAIGHQVKILTIGNTNGLPQWVADKVNNIFNCSNVTLDGISIVRNESSVPELVKLNDYYPMFVHRLNVEQTDEEYHTGIDEYAYVLNTDYNRVMDTDGNYIKAKY